MKSKRLFTALIAASLASGIMAGTVFAGETEDAAMKKRQENIEIVTSFMDQVFNAHVNDKETLDKFMRDDYMQHNAEAGDGKDGFIGFTDFFFTLEPRMEIQKIFANDNDEVAVFFTCYCDAAGTVNKVVDIYRIEDGLLAEHWDVVEHDVGAVETASGRELFSTDSESTPSVTIAEQNANIETIIAFNDEVFTSHNNSAELLDAYMRDDYMQHNATVADGKMGFVEFTDFFFTLEPEMKIYKTFSNEDGEVAVFFKCICNANGMINKVCDIYRLNDGKLAEHWDVVEHDVGAVETASGRDLFE